MTSLIETNIHRLDLLGKLSQWSGYVNDFGCLDSVSNIFFFFWNWEWKTWLWSMGTFSAMLSLADSWQSHKLFPPLVNCQDHFVKKNVYICLVLINHMFSCLMFSINNIRQVVILLLLAISQYCRHWRTHVVMAFLNNSLLTKSKIGDSYELGLKNGWYYLSCSN